jgi:hypothetical protein
VSTDGRTYWWMKDAAWHRREFVVELGEAFGPGGPLALDWLACEAKAANDAGRVKSGYGTLGRGVFVSRDEAEVIVRRAAEIGALDDFEELDGRRFVCRVSGWQADQERGLKQGRNDRHRAKASDETVSRRLTPAHAGSLRPGEEEEEERSCERDIESSSTGVKDGDALTEVFDHWKQECRSTSRRPTLTRHRSNAIAHRLNDGYSVEQLKQAITNASYAGIGNRQAVDLPHILHLDRIEAAIADSFNGEWTESPFPDHPY